MIDQLKYERLKNELILDEETGFLFWKTSNQRRRAGERAGVLCNDGYRHISFEYSIFMEHTVIWYIANGEIVLNLDHKDKIRDHNAPSNLRKATYSQQQANARRKVNATGFRGVYFHRQNAKYYSQLKVNGKRLYLGYFDEAVEAHEAYKIAHKAHFGEFSNV